MAMRMSKMLEILGKFKSWCKNKGWKAPEDQDWIESRGYHNFLWAKEVSFSSFKRITMNQECTVSNGQTYHVVNPAYTAWLFSETPSRGLMQMVFENPDFSSRIALYDLSNIIEGRDTCFRFNATDSQVFQAFEDFLRDHLGVRFEPFSAISRKQMETGNLGEKVLAS